MNMMELDVFTIPLDQLFINVLPVTHGMVSHVFWEEQVKIAQRAHIGMEINAILLIINLEVFLLFLHHPHTLFLLQLETQQLLMFHPHPHHHLLV